MVVATATGPPMHPVKILVIPGSIRAGSHNARLAALATKVLTLADAEVTRISLADFSLPLYDADLEASSGPPQNAVNLKRMMLMHHGVFIASPELHASIAPLLKNAIDWIARVRERNEQPGAAFRGRAFALGSASRDENGGLYGLLALRQVLETGCGAMVIPAQIAVPHAAQAFDDMDELVEPRLSDQLNHVVRQLIETAKHFV
jgi:NAD(P)H-dependent FMN reductase